MEFILNPIYFDDTPIVFFDGVAYDNICGIEIYLKITTDHTVKAHFVGGNGNNMKVELLGKSSEPPIALHDSKPYPVLAGYAQIIYQK
jgi:hypothetical protein